jgi:transcriptional regulator with XRE-family HTH domain
MRRKLTARQVRGAGATCSTVVEEPWVDTVLQALGPAVRALRQSRGLTQAVLGERTGVGQPYISASECGRAKPSLRMVLLVAIALGVEVDALIGHANASINRRDDDGAGAR